MTVCGLSHKRAKQSDPRLGWIMFHKIVNMCRDIKLKEEHACEMVFEHHPHEQVRVAMDDIVCKIENKASKTEKQ
eukprot:8575386-Ditylum_brightwellii.AAC.1